MAVLTNTQLKAIRANLDRQKSSGKIPHGYPVALVTDLLDTLEEMRKRKKTFQHLAERRARLLAQIFSISSRAVSENTDSVEELW